MKYNKSKVVSLIGLSILLFFIALSYFNDQLFFEKLIICSAILGIIFLVKIIGENSSTKVNKTNKYSKTI